MEEKGQKLTDKIKEIELRLIQVEGGTSGINQINPVSREFNHGVDRHTHNGVDSPKLKIKDVQKNKLPSDIGGEYDYYATASTSGTLRIGYGGSAPQLTTTSITDSLGGIHTGVDVSSLANVNQYLVDTQNLLNKLIPHVESLTRVLIQNGFVSYIQNPSSDNFDPQITYFDR